MTVRLLVVSQYWEPAELAGGARSTGRAVAALAGPVDTWVVSGDRDVGDAGPWPTPVACSGGAGAWVDRGAARVQHQRWDRGAGARVARAVDEIAPDVIYLPSLFAPGSLAVLWRRALGAIRPTVVVAPEGELHPGALAHHRGRKRAVVALLRASGLAGRLRWRAVDVQEAAHIRAAVGRRARIDLAPDLHDPPTPVTTGLRDLPPKHPGRARVVFVGTVVPKKGLHRALELLWPSRHQIDLDIYGPVVDDAEWARCRSVLDRCEPDVAWAAHGPIAHDEVGPLLAAADLCILPTLGENYGYVIAEALDAGCPVLTSDQTPWIGLADDGCGWDLPLEPTAAWRDAVAQVIGWDDDRRRAARRAARERAERAHRAAEADVGAWRALIDGAARATWRR